MGTSRIVLFGHFGSGNIGNDSTLEAMVHAVKKYRPLSTITCVCTGPEAIEKRLGIDTVPIDLWDQLDSADIVENALTAPTRVLRRIGDEIDFWLRLRSSFRSVDLFVVVGTGALDDMAVRHPWNAPYDLFKWCWGARLSRARIVFLSVGAGPIVNPISRVLMLGALRTAHYRSYRDQPSVQYLKSVGFDCRLDRVYPDLVFGVPLEGPIVGRPPSQQPRTIGLGVIGYYGWRHDIRAGEPIYREYVSKLKRFLKWLFDEGYVVNLLAGDFPTDQRTIDEILAFAREARPSDWEGRIICEACSSLDQLQRQIAQTDIVVVTRFHNVVCALMQGKPAISLGYHTKNDALMDEMGLGAYCQQVERFDVDHLIAQFRSLVAEAGLASERIQIKCAEYRQLLDEQYRLILASRQSAVRNENRHTSERPEVVRPR